MIWHIEAEGMKWFAVNEQGERRGPFDTPHEAQTLIDAFVQANGWHMPR